LNVPQEGRGWPEQVRHDDCYGGFVKTIVITLAIVACSVPAHAQTLPGGFVFLRDVDPTIIQDIRYAGSNNFIGRPLRGMTLPNVWSSATSDWR
jgi:D-alanyl-D-alanine dipeptidase